jgi:hypothetical protein
MGILFGFSVGYPFGLFINDLNEKEKNGGREKYPRGN